MSSHYERGLVLYKLKNYKAAETEFREYLASNSQSASGHAMLAMSLNALCKTAVAHKEAMEAVRLSPDYSYAHYTLSFTFAAQKNSVQAERAILEAISLSPTDCYLYTRASQINFSARKYQPALDYADQGLLCDPDNDSCLVARGASLLELGRLDEADATLTKALALDPESYLAHLNMGATQLRIGDKTRAFEHYRESLRLKPTDHSARVGAIAALKSRNPIYYTFLKGSFAIRRINRTVVIGLLLVFYTVEGLRLLVAALIFGSVILNQLQILLLRFDKQGKTLLAEREISYNNRWVVTTILVLAAIAGIVNRVFDQDRIAQTRTAERAANRRILENFAPPKSQ